MQWTVRSKAAGRLVLPRGEDLPGSFVEKEYDAGICPRWRAGAGAGCGARGACGAAARARAAGRGSPSEERATLPARLAREVQPRPGCCRARRSASLRVEAMPSIPRTRTASGRSIRYSSSASPWSARRWGAWAAAPGCAPTWGRAAGDAMAAPGAAGAAQTLQSHELMRAAQLPMPGALWGRYPERRGRRRRAPPARSARRAMARSRELRAAHRFAALAMPRSLQHRRAAPEARAARPDGAGHGAGTGNRQRACRPGARRASRLCPDLRRPRDARRTTGGDGHGEGKTLAAALAAATAALARVPVHVITVNDYLASRDGENLARLYARLGLTTGIVTQQMDAASRRAAYACDITCTAKELVFDYLRDSIVRGQHAGTLQERIAGLSPQRTVLRGFAWRSSTRPTACSSTRRACRSSFRGRARRRPPGQALQGALALAERLIEGRDFSLDAGLRIATLTASGRRAARVERAGGRPPVVAAALSRGGGEPSRSARCPSLPGIAITSCAGPRGDHRSEHGTNRAGARLVARPAPDDRAQKAAGPAPVLETTAEMTYQRFFPAISGFVA